MCVSTGNVGALHLPMSLSAHWDVMPDSVAGQDRREKKRSKKERNKKKLRLLALIQDRPKDKIY